METEDLHQKAIEYAKLLGNFDIVKQFSETLENTRETLNGQNEVLASIRQDVANFRREICGNGQPGRLTKIETSVEDLKEHKNRTIGWIAGAFAVLPAATGIFEFFLHSK